MWGSGKCKENFCAHYGAAEKIQEKSQKLLRRTKKKLRLSALPGFSVLVSQSLEFSFSGKTKIQMLINFAEFDIVHPRPFKILWTYLWFSPNVPASRLISSPSNLWVILLTFVFNSSSSMLLLFPDWVSVCFT